LFQVSACDYSLGANIFLLQHSGLSLDSSSSNGGVADKEIKWFWWW
jgi:hypothetical protein